jgi:predicted Na+-dependent transporter
MFERLAKCLPRKKIMRETWYYIAALVILAVPIFIVQTFVHTETSRLREFAVLCMVLSMVSLHSSGYLLGVVHARITLLEEDEEKAMKLHADTTDTHKHKPQIQESGYQHI